MRQWKQWNGQMHDNGEMIRKSWTKCKLQCKHVCMGLGGCAYGSFRFSIRIQAIFFFFFIGIGGGRVTHASNSNAFLYQWPLAVLFKNIWVYFHERVDMIQGTISKTAGVLDLYLVIGTFFYLLNGLFHAELDYFTILELGMVEMCTPTVLLVCIYWHCCQFSHGVEYVN